MDQFNWGAGGGGASIPRSLDAICAKAMAARPADRYESAEQMSEDVERFLDGQPVEARPENLLERGARLLAKYQALVWIILAYLLIRLAILAFTGR